MAVEAGHGHMPPGKGKSRRAVPAEREGRWSEPLDRMATLAAIVVSRAGELAFVDVRVAVQTLGVFDPVIGARPGGDMTLRAWDGRVPSFQGIGGGGVLGHAKFHGFESLHCVARLASAAVLACVELPAVGIRSVAVGAFPVSQRHIKRLAMVAGAAPHVRVLAQQRIVGSGVIEDSAHPAP